MRAVLVCEECGEEVHQHIFRPGEVALMDESYDDAVARVERDPESFCEVHHCGEENNP